MKRLLEIIKEAEYDKYSKKFKCTIGFDMCVNEIILDKKGILYSLAGMNFDECFNLIVESMDKNKNFLLEQIKNNKIEYDPAVVY